jgi:hypothetical protein
MSATVYALLTGLMIAATQGAWWVAAFVLLVGPAVGVAWARRAA